VTPLRSPSADPAVNPEGDSDVFSCMGVAGSDAPDEFGGKGVPLDSRLAMRETPLRAEHVGQRTRRAERNEARPKIAIIKPKEPQVISIHFADPCCHSRMAAALQESAISRKTVPVTS
jgi:hypothetical protein